MMKELVEQKNTIIRVALADDHQIFRKGVMAALKLYSNIKFVLEAENGDELLAGLPQATPEVILMDLQMPLKDGVETTKIVSKQYPHISVLVLTMHEDKRFVKHLMEIGANGYLLKNTDPQEIRRAIMSVHEKGYYLNHFVNRILIGEGSGNSKSPPSFSPDSTINHKEKKVLQSICSGLTAQEIAQLMLISPRTVEAIKDRMIERFGVKNTAALVFFAVKNNLVD